jgi:uncharacterized protein
MRSRLAAPGAVALLLAAACLEPRAVRMRFYTLPEAPAAGAEGRPLPSLGLGPVTLPAYLDRPELATRASPERIAYSGEDRWASPLADQVWRALAEDLRTRVPVGAVVPWPWPREQAPPLGVAVEFRAFEPGPDGAAVLEARWTLSPGAGGPPLASGSLRVREEPATRDAEGAVGALGRALGALSRDVAAAVAALPPR